MVIFQIFRPFLEIKELEIRQNLNYSLLVQVPIIKYPGFKNVILFNILASVDEKVLPDVSLYKGCCGHQASSHCRCPQLCSLKGFRLGKSRILVLRYL